MTDSRNPNLIFSVLLCFDAVLTIELINAASCGSGFLLASVERMALGADFYVDLLLSGSGYELVAAVADHLGLIILRMNSVFHFFHLVILFWMVPNIL